MFSGQALYTISNLFILLHTPQGRRTFPKRNMVQENEMTFPRSHSRAPGDPRTEALLFPPLPVASCDHEWTLLHLAMPRRPLTNICWILLQALIEGICTPSIIQRGPWFNCATSTPTSLQTNTGEPEPSAVAATVTGIVQSVSQESFKAGTFIEIVRIDTQV